MTLMALVKHLSDGEFHSGSELGELLGVSRAAVWKQVQKLESDFGVVCDSVKGKGYQIRGGLDLLDKHVIFECLSGSTKQYISCLDLCSVVGSTNDVVLEKAKQGVKPGYICIAEHQLKGRGRRGREWVSPFGKNIYMSVLWGFQGGAAALEGLSLAAGVAVSNALHEVGLIDVQLKWPNDILFEEKKMAGILLEMTGDASGACEVVLGIGLNLGMLREDGESIEQDWVDLREASNKSLNRNYVAAKLIDSVLIMLQRFSDTGFQSFVEEWSELDLYGGREVSVTTIKGSVHGVAMGVSDNGSLKLKTDNGVKLISGGEVSLRLSQ